MLALLLAVLVVCAFFYHHGLLTRVLRWLWPEVLWSIDTPQAAVAALTIDDSPWGDGSSTEALLDVLKEQGVTATFFVISGQIQTDFHRSLIRRMVAEGHEIGNHGTDEDRAILLPDETYVAALRECDRVLSEYQPVVRFHRPGSGLFTRKMLSHMKPMGYRMILGNVFPHDPAIKYSWHTSWFLRWRTHPGSVVIVHDRPWTAPALRHALPALASRVQLVSVSEMLQRHSGSSSSSESSGRRLGTLNETETARESSFMSVLL